MDIMGNDFPHTYGDGYGSVIDWSGCVGVAVCLEPGCQDNQTGPYFSLEDTKAGAAQHRRQMHVTNDKTNPLKMSPEAIEASKTADCVDCGKKARRRGLCYGCTNTRTKAWLVLNGYMDPEDSLSGYQEAARDYAPRPVKPVEPKPAPVERVKTEPKEKADRKDHPWGHAGRHKLPIRHGTRYAYNVRKCRCEACTEANTQYSRNRRVPKPPKEIKHGTLNGYDYHKCRCEPCRTVAAEYRRNYRNKKRDTNG